ncbi:MAG: RNA polymerase sigma factor [Candidatus Sumerlaeia bacterium]
MSGVEPIALEREAGDEQVAAWLAGARAGSEEMFALLMARFRPMIWGLAWRMGLSHDDAWDISQQMVLRIWQALPKYRPEQNLAGWIRTIAVREGLRWLDQTRKTRRAIGIDDLATIPAQLRVDNDGPRMILAGERRERIEAALVNLSGQQRAAVVLRFYEDMTVGEIAEAMECAEGTVKQHLFRAMAKLRRALKKDEQP